MLTLRDATPADAGDIAAVHVESWQSGYRGLMPDEVLDGLSVATREQWWWQTLSSPGVRATLLVVEADTLLGFAAVGTGRDGDPVIGELYAMYLRSTAWGRGVGCTLHAAAMARLEAFGFERASLWMLAGNQRAQRFYHREGWAADGRSKLVAGPGGVELDHRGMARPLGS
jgi:RimJ/RimL family protein N-acetyltransferase